MEELKSVIFKDLGRINYKEAWDFQESIFSGVLNNKSENRNRSDDNQIRTTDYLLFAEHNPVYTLGKSGDMNNLLANKNELDDLGIEFFKINRGGDITYHGPGQLVGYPILNLDHFLRTYIDTSEHWKM